MRAMVFWDSSIVLVVIAMMMAATECAAQTAPNESPKVPGVTGPVSSEAVAAADEPGQQDQAEAQTKATKKAEPDEKKGEWLLAPIPIKSPAVGAGLEWAVARIFPLNKKDEVSPPSVVGVGGLFTNNGSRAIAGAARLYLKEDKYRVMTAFGRASINADIYGIGKSAGDNGTYLPMNVDGKGIIGEGLYGLKKGVFLGLRGQFRRLAMGLDQEKMDSDEISHQPPAQVAEIIQQLRQDLSEQKTASLGPRFQWDTRESVFYPRHGLFMDVNADFFAEGLGSKWTYQYYKAAFNKYNALSEHQVLAFRAMGCAAAGNHVPIYDTCLFGTMNDLRGYSAGRYQDRRMFAIQGEYRLMFPAKGFLGRFGVVAFAGFGAVGEKFTEIGFSDLLPAGGGGVRFRVLKKQPVNFRLDYAVGKVGNTLTIGVLEAF